MSYYTLGLEFWGDVGLFFGLLPLLAVATNSMLRLFARTTEDVPLSSSPV